MSVAPCRSFVAQLKATGADASLTEYPNTWHQFDVSLLPPLYDVKKAQSTRNCQLKEGPNGVIVNAVSMAPFAQNSDPCVVLGAHVGSNADSAAAAREAIATLPKQTLLQ